MKKEKQTSKDPQLDAPSVANQNKHINFLAEEENQNEPGIVMDLDNEQVEQRRREWQEGIEAGKKENQKGEKE